MTPSIRPGGGNPAKTGAVARRKALLLFALLLAALLPRRAHTADDDGPPKNPPERMLANIEAGKRVPDSDPRVAEIRAALVKADSLYKEDLERVMALTYHCWKEIRDDGQPVSMTEVLGGSLDWQNPLYFKRGVEREFAEYVALYLATRIDFAKKNGKPRSHKETIASMRAAADALTLPPSPAKPKAKQKARKPRR